MDPTLNPGSTNYSPSGQRDPNLPIAPEILSGQTGPWAPRRRFGLLAILGWICALLCIPVMLIIVLLIVVGSFSDWETGDSIQEKHHSLSNRGSQKVAIISVTGAIMESDGFIKHQIDRVRKDDAIKGVVLRIDSPGGTVSGSDYIYHHLSQLRAKKSETETDFPIVVSMGGIAASGGYYIAMAVGDQEQSIYAEPTTTTGSIGVIIPHYDISGLLTEHKIKDDSITSHPRKQMLSMTREMTEEDRRILKAYVDDAFARFKEVVKSGRPALEEDQPALDELATGEIFSARQAQKKGLVDEIGFIEDAIDRVIELASLDKDDVQVVKYVKPVTLFELATMHAQSPRGLGLASLLELSTPRAYYLCTSLPLLMTSRRP